MFEKIKKRKQLNELAKVEEEKAEFYELAVSCFEGGSANINGHADSIAEEYNKVAENCKQGNIISKEDFNEMSNYTQDREYPFFLNRYYDLEQKHKFLVNSSWVSDEEKEKITEMFKKAHENIKGALKKISKSIDDCQSTIIEYATKKNQRGR